jgi:hypothetical protein
MITFGNLSATLYFAHPLKKPTQNGSLVMSWVSYWV